MKKVILQFILIFSFVFIGCESSEDSSLNNNQVIDNNNNQCFRPDGLTALNITSNSVTFYWDNTSGSQLFNVEYGARGFTIGSGTRISSNTNTKDVNGLSPVTEYDFYVRANCGGNIFSTWSGPHSFVTN